MPPFLASRQALPSFLHGEGSCNLAHGGKKRKCPIIQLDCFISKTYDPFLKQRIGKIAVCSKVKVCKEDLARPHAIELHSDGSFTFKTISASAQTSAAPDATIAPALE